MQLRSPGIVPFPRRQLPRVEFTEARLFVIKRLDNPGIVVAGVADSRRNLVGVQIGLRRCHVRSDAVDCFLPRAMILSFPLQAARRTPRCHGQDKTSPHAVGVADCPIWWFVSNEVSILQSGEHSAQRIGINAGSVGDLTALERLISVCRQKANNLLGVGVRLLELRFSLKALDVDWHVCIFVKLACLYCLRKDCNNSN